MDRITLQHTSGGIPVVVEKLNNAISSGYLVAVGTGSRDETPEIAGISHLLEHVVFRATDTRSSLQISKEMEEAGGEMNAFTAKEVTAFYGITLSDTANVAKDLVADICANPAIRQSDIDLEKKIVLQEISMWENDPESYIHKLFAETLWDGHELSQNEAGNVKSVKGLKEKDLRQYFENRYKRPNMAVVACGATDPEDVLSWAEEAFDHRGTGIKIQRKKPRNVLSSFRLFTRKGDHNYVGMGFEAYPADHPDRATVKLLNAILGSGMSSRLFQGVREEKALVYSIYNSIDQNSDAASMATYMSSTEENVMEAIETTASIYKDLRDNGLHSGELERARNLLKGATVRQMESTSARLYRLTRAFMLTGKAEPFTCDLDALNHVSEDDIMRVANDLISSKGMTVAVYGKETGKLKNFKIDQLDL